MPLLIAGILLWCVVHPFRRLFPGLRDRLTETVGLGPSKGIISGLLLLAIVLMFLGFRRAPYVPLWDFHPWAVWITDIAMFFSVMLFGLGSSRSRFRGALRHPMLTGAFVWASAHLLANGELAALVLFGSMAVWSLAEMQLINARSGPWERPAPGTAGGDLRLVVISLVIYVIIVTVHFYSGHYPFPV